MGRRHADQRRDIFSAWAKAPLKSDIEYEVILVDAAESSIERPKKSKNGTIPERKSGTH